MRETLTLNSVTLRPGFAEQTLAAKQPVSGSPTPRAGIHINGHAMIFSAATVLALATATECKSITHIPSLLYGLELWLWWGVVASGLWRLGRKKPEWLRFTTKTVAAQILTGSVLGIAHLLLLGSLGFVVPEWRAKGGISTLTELLNLNRFGMELVMYGFLFGMTGIIQFQMRAQRDAMRALELERQLSAAHLRALQMQLEPHFLFNTLNAITTLVELGRSKEASEMLTHLNAILKSTLKRSTPEKVPLAEELEMIESYLAIEQVRFADRLRVSINVEPAALNGLVPCFLLQPIVENAIRHGISHCEDNGLIEAFARSDGDTLHLTVRDSGPGQGNHSQEGHGIGLSNTRDRLTHFYQDGYAMVAGPVASGGFEVDIAIPYERS
jgi:sensor histidine kinase YesM